MDRWPTTKRGFRWDPPADIQVHQFQSRRSKWRTKNQPPVYRHNRLIFYPAVATPAPLPKLDRRSSSCIRRCMLQSRTPHYVVYSGAREVSTSCVSHVASGEFADRQTVERTHDSYTYTVSQKNKTPNSCP